MSEANKVVEIRVEHGSPLPHDGGVNFSLFSSHAKNVELLLYDTLDVSKHQLPGVVEPQENKGFYRACRILTRSDCWSGQLIGPFS